MDKRFIKIIGILFFILVSTIGMYVIYQVISPEIVYQVDIKNNEEVAHVIDSKQIIEVNRIMIPSIGVDVEIGTDYSILDTGGWVQDLNQDDVPNLIGIHRFGLDTLSPQEKIKTTLYHVYKLNKGDEVVVWWEGEEYVYEVQDVYEDTKKPDVKEGNLYLYTCLFWGEEERVFVTSILRQPSLLDY